MVQSLGAKKFLSSEEGDLIRQELEDMMKNPQFNTTSTYSPASVGQLEFVDKHMDYLSKHPAVNRQHYLSNLRLMTKITPKKD